MKGIGFNLDKDIPLQSTMGTITITNNIDNTSDASGTIITGLTTGGIFLGFATGPAYVLQDVVIENCLFVYVVNFGSTTYVPIDNLEIRGCQNTSSVNTGFGSHAIGIVDQITNSIVRDCVLGATSVIAVGFTSTTPVTNIISNNILYGPIRVDAEGSNTSILNNDFIGGTGTSSAFSSFLRDCIVANNIFYGKTPSLLAAGGSTSTNFQRNTFTNNLSYSTGNDMLPPDGGGAGNSGTGNIESMSPLFQNVPLLDVWDPSYDFTLTGGPAINAGSDGTDIGISGGAFPYPDVNFFNTTTAFPIIQILNTSTVINPGDDLNVRIKASGN